MYGNISEEIIGMRNRKQTGSKKDLTRYPDAII
jgi:hypothetical protein